MTVEGRVMLGNLDASNIRLSLNGMQYHALTSIDGSFRFYDIPSGIYSLDVLDTRFLYSQLKLKVTAEDSTVTVVEYKYPGAKRNTAEYPIELKPHSRIGYFQKREGFSIWKMIMGNPTMIMMAFMMGMIFFVPQMMKNMDPEQLKEMQEQSMLNQAGVDPNDPMKALMGMFGSGGKKDDDDDE